MIATPALHKNPSYILELKCRKGFTNSDFSDKIKGDTVYICLYLCIHNFCGKIIGFSADY